MLEPSREAFYVREYNHGGSALSILPFENNYASAGPLVPLVREKCGLQYLNAHVLCHAFGAITGSTFYYLFLPAKSHKQ